MGRSSAAGIRKTIEVWYDWFFPVRTRKSWATAADVERIRKAIHPPWTWSRRGRNGVATAQAAPTTATR